MDLPSPGALAVHDMSIAAQLTELASKPVFGSDVLPAAALLARQHRPFLERTWREYGVLSRAAYAAKFTLESDLLKIYCTPHTAQDRESPRWSAVRSLLDLVHRSLSAQFYLLAPDGAAPLVQCTAPQNADRVCVYTFDATEYERRMASDGRRVRQGIRIVRGALPPTLQAARCYLFCIAGNGDLLLYQRAMQYRDLAVGLFDMGIEIKHPMLVQDHRLSVRCAGEMFLAQRTGATIAGMLVSRTSGHFRPGGATVASLRDAAAAMGVAQSRVFIVGDEPPSR